jgi:hypothetical protein
MLVLYSAYAHPLPAYTFRLRARNGLFVITDTAAQIADLGYEAHFLKVRRGGVRLWKHVGRYLGDLTFRLLRRGIDCFTIRAAFGVLYGSNVRTLWVRRERFAQKTGGRAPLA